MHATSPAESVHALDVTGLSAPSMSFWAAFDGESALGCVALKEHDPGFAELKSMRTDAAARGRGLGKLLLAHVLDVARERGYARVSLETGSEDFFIPARTLYAANGFVECGPFADYTLDPNSVYMTLELSRPAA
ncbi:GNAT family N-acetyltransferase [Agromyces sp. MMS17-SY077]|uniref:GNAT family N-acetyltransferase n=2 Tax=Agromyces seonyuensis TaxID=2662446 RepID=A0A6I4NZJ7_9MICO|nr:GNAT family N-acetyltransferase [Agromyces seonyuensis]